MFGHRVREIVVVGCKCMENDDSEWNEEKISGIGSEAKDYEAIECYGGDILLKIQKFDS